MMIRVIRCRCCRGRRRSHACPRAQFLVPRLLNVRIKIDYQVTYANVPFVVVVLKVIGRIRRGRIQFTGVSSHCACFIKLTLLAR